MPVYDCSESDFMENLKKISKNIEVIIHKKIETRVSNRTRLGRRITPSSDRLEDQIQEFLVESSKSNIPKGLAHYADIRERYGFRLVDLTTGQSGYRADDLDALFEIIEAEYSFTWGTNAYIHQFTIYTDYKIVSTPRFGVQVKKTFFWNTPINKFNGEFTIETIPPDPKLAELPLPKNIMILAGEIGS